MSFNEYVKDNKLTFPIYHSINIDSLSKFLLSNSQITELQFNHYKNVNCINSLFKSGALKNITSLTLSGCSISNENIKELAKMKNLTSLKLISCSINDEGIKELFPLLKGGLEDLDLSENKNSSALIKRLFDNDMGIKKYILNSQKKVSMGKYNGFFPLLKNFHNTKDDKQIAVQKLFYECSLSMMHGLMWEYFPSIVKIENKDFFIALLDDFDQYPYLINGQDENGRCTISRICPEDPEGKKIFFERGLIPEKNPEIFGIIDNQHSSSNDSQVTQRIKFLTKKLVESTKASGEELKKAANSFCEDALKLSETYKEDPIRCKLICLTDSEKRDVMKNVPSKEAPTPNDEEFIKKIINKAIATTRETYLKKKENGEFDGEYFTQRMQYDFQDDNAKISIPESIGRIKLLIDKYNIPLEEKKELLVTLIVQNPELVKSSIKAKSKDFDECKTSQSDIHNLLKDIDDKEVNELFKEISDLEIDEIWREQKLFILIKQLYIAATTYGENKSACSPGTWSQIIDSLSDISTKILKEYDQYCEVKLAEEKNKNNITEENIKPFTEELAEHLIKYVEDKSELNDTLEDFAVATVYIDRPKEITFEQQEILAEINKYFSQNIKKFLPHYDKSIPNFKEYEFIINGLAEVGIMRNFVDTSYSNSVSNNKSEQTEAQGPTGLPGTAGLSGTPGLKGDTGKDAKSEEVKRNTEETDNSKRSPEFTKAMLNAIISLSITTTCVGVAIGFIGVPTVAITGIIIVGILGIAAIVGGITYAVSKHQSKKETEEKHSPGTLNGLSIRSNQEANMR